VLRLSRRILAASLAVWFFAMSVGYAGPFAAELEHDLACMELGIQPPDSSKGDGACPHGCTGHLAGHLFTIAQHDDRSISASVKADDPPTPRPHAWYSLASSVFLPPKILLA
jgi:hypothetical protein